MAKRVRSGPLESRSSRTKLEARHAPYWAVITPGLMVGYRKGARGGVWFARHEVEGKRLQERLAIADDIADADGLAVLDFWQAQEKARSWLADLARQAEEQRQRDAGELVEPPPPYTVTNAIDDYLEAYSAGQTKGGGKALSTTKASIDAFIGPALGSEEVANLTPQRIRQWLEALAKAPARRRTSKDLDKRRKKVGKKAIEQKVIVPVDTSNPEAVRRRRSSANRLLTVLKSILNHAWHDGKVTSDDAWRRVKPFKEVDTARVRYLTADECRRLANACPFGFRQLVQAALFTGCRYGELTALRVNDFNPDSGTVHVRASKAGTQRHVVLTAEGTKIFTTHCAGRPADALMFARDGVAWGKDWQHRPLKEACAAAKILPAASFHVLRHSYGSQLVMAGVPLPVVSQNMGHADTRMTIKHYAHLAPSYVADAIRASAPSLGILEESNVVPLTGQR